MSDRTPKLVQIAAYVPASLAKLVDERARLADVSTSKYVGRIIAKGVRDDVPALASADGAR